MKKFNYLNFLIADDHSLIRHGAFLMINESFDKCHIVQASNIKDVKKYCKLSVFDLIILDLTFPDGEAVEVIKFIRSIQPQVKILIFSAHDEQIYAIRCLNEGADGYLQKDCTEDEFIKAVKSMFIYGKYVSERLNDKILNNYLNNKSKNPFEDLSNREIQIANLLVNGLSNGQISEKLNLKRSTVSTYKLRIFEKLRISNLSDLIQKYMVYNKQIK